MYFNSIDVVNILGVFVAALGILVTILIGWQIIQIGFLRKTINDVVKQRIKDYDKEIAYSLYRHKIEYLRYLMMTTSDANQFESAVYYVSEISRELNHKSKHLKTQSDEDLFLSDIKQLLNNVDARGYELPQTKIRELIAALSPYSFYSDWRETLDWAWARADF